MTGLKVPTGLKRTVVFISDGNGRQTCLVEDPGKVDPQLRKLIQRIRKLLDGAQKGR